MLVTGATGKVGCATVRSLLSVRDAALRLQRVSPLLSSRLSDSLFARLPFWTLSLPQDRFQSGSLTVRAGAKEADHLKACKEKHPQLQTAVFDYDDPATYGAALLGVSTVFLVEHTLDRHLPLAVDCCTLTLSLSSSVSVT